jgi:ADP-dependent NAD(P)H-hydrate dehydratase / NAD(P)H-hydrate epimerase
LLKEYLLNGGAVVDLYGSENFEVFQAALVPGTVVLDGILGTGLTLPLRGSLQEVMANIHKRLEKRLDLLIIAVDCPSGVDCDTGEVSEVTVRADHTLTMAAMKQGLLRTSCPRLMQAIYITLRSAPMTCQNISLLICLR